MSARKVDHAKIFIMAAAIWQRTNDPLVAMDASLIMNECELVIGKQPNRPDRKHLDPTKEHSLITYHKPK